MISKNTVVQMAREAGSSHEGPLFVPDAFVLRFAHLIEDHLRFDGIHSCGNDCQRPACVQAREQRARIYEECAKAVEVFDKTFQTGGVIAHAIRARIK